MSEYTPPTYIDDAQSTPEMTKYLRVPMDEEEEFEIRESIARRRQSNFLSRVVGISIILAVAASLTGGIIFYTEHHKKHSRPSIVAVPTSAPTSVDPLEVCYAAVSCPSVGSNQPKYDPSTGFTNYTGWFDGIGIEKCCNICSPNLSPLESESADVTTTMPKLNVSSSAFRFNLSSFDYIIFDQMWIPQLCNALANGHDPTLSHTSTSRCEASVYSSPAEFTRLSVHGVWPSMKSGTFLSCCGATLEQAHLSTVDPVVMATWDIYESLAAEWFDPTSLQSAVLSYSADLSSSTSQLRPAVLHESVSRRHKGDGGINNVSCGTCFLQNHEYQKHGTCFGSGVDASYVYFGTGLNLSAVLAPIANQLDDYAGTVVTLESVQSLYPKSVNVLCDPQMKYEGTIQVFFEVRTCWSLTSEEPEYRVNYALGDEDRHWGLEDCPAAGSSKFSNPCDVGGIYFPVLEA